MLSVKEYINNAASLCSPDMLSVEIEFLENVTALSFYKVFDESTGIRRIAFGDSQKNHERVVLS